MKRQRLNVIRMEMLGAKVVPALSGQRTLKEAVDEALAAWIANPDTFYVLGSAVGPHPYPTMVRHFQAVIGCEAREQMLAECGKLPVAAFACVGGRLQCHRPVRRICGRCGRASYRCGARRDAA